MLLISTGAACGSSGRDSESGSGTSQPTIAPTGDAPEVVDEFCGLVVEWAEAEREAKRIDKENNPEGYIRILDKQIRMFKEVPAAAPPSIKADMAVITSIPPDPARVSEALQREQAVERADEYVADKCDARFSFSRYNFLTS